MAALPRLWWRRVESFLLVNPWDTDQLVATASCFLLSAIALTAKTVGNQDEVIKGFLKKLLLDTQRITAAVEFVVVVHSFSLPIELVLIPLVTALAVLAQYAELKEDYASPKFLISILLIFAVFVMLIKSLGQIAERPGTFLLCQQDTILFCLSSLQ